MKATYKVHLNDFRNRDRVFQMRFRQRIESRLRGSFSQQPDRQFSREALHGRKKEQRGGLSGFGLHQTARKIQWVVIGFLNLEFLKTCFTFSLRINPISRLCLTFWFDLCNYVQLKKWPIFWPLSADERSIFKECIDSSSPFTAMTAVSSGLWNGSRFNYMKIWTLEM